MLSVILWYINLLLIGWVAWPITAYLFPAFKDKGYAFSRSLGLMLAGFLFWILATFKVLQNDTGGVLAAVILVLAFSLLVQHYRPQYNYRELVKSAKNSIFWVEGLFLVCFVLIALWRASNPDITGTEKPMELAFINSILRSPSFPPNDPWLSGYSISYYYFGYVIISMLIRLSGAISGVAFNLMAASIFSLAAIGLYGLMFNIINAPQVQEWLKRKQKSKPVTDYVLPLIAPFFMLILSNMEGIFEFLYVRGLFWTKAADGSWTSGFWKWFGLQEMTAYPTMPLAAWPNRPGVIWWRASRVLADFGTAKNFEEVIDEFPFFSFLLSDLHPHVLAIPFGVLALAFGLNLILGGAKGKITVWDVEFHLPWTYMVAVPIFIGGMSFMNTWDFPVQLGIFLLCCLVVRIREDGWSGDRIWELIGNGIVLGGLSILVYLPFFIGFKSQAGGIVPSFVFYTRGAQFWMMFGTLLIPLFFFLIHLVIKNASLKNALQGLKWSSILVFGMWIIMFLLAFIAMNLTSWGQDLSLTASAFLQALGSKMVEGGDAFVVKQGLNGYSFQDAVNTVMRLRFTAPGAWITLWLFFTLGFTAISASARKTVANLEKKDTVQKPLADGMVFVLILALCGGLVVMVPEFIYLRDQFGTRMNTIFKFYYQGWLLWSLAASFGVIYLIHRLDGVPAILAGIILPVTVALGLIYPVIGLRSTTNDFKPGRLTLNGNAHLDEYQADESLAMKWLAQAPYGVLAESVGGSYSANARMSVQSGLPAVIGWTPHEGQWGRTYVEMGSRDQDMAKLYSTGDWNEAQTILNTYHIRYVVVGNLEKTTYQVNQDKFNQHLPIVYQNNSVTIYEYPGSVYETK
jgi:YYY domain-containing protein